MNANGLDPDSRCLVYLGRVCRDIRQDAGLSMELLGVAAGSSSQVIRRFEHGKTVPRDLEDVVCCYAEIAGRDAREVWKEAVDRWVKYGLRPSPPESFESLRAMIDMQIQETWSDG